MVDWDEDGDKDLIVGDIWGAVWLFTNIGTSYNPVLTRTGRIEADNEPIDAGYFAVPVIVDWNNDHKKDLILGTESKGIRIYLNIGTDNEPLFSKYTTIDSAYFFRGHPEVVDLNEDGRKDLLVGAMGFVYYFKNQGSDENPEFSHGIRLKLRNNEDIQVFERTHVDASDWNNDGKIDLIIGDNDGYILVYLNNGVLSAISEIKTQPKKYELFQNYPNPFGTSTRKKQIPTLHENSQTIISFTLQKREKVVLSIYDSRGRFIRRLINRTVSKGIHSVSWNGTNDQQQIVSTGVYFYVLRVNQERLSRKMLFFSK